MHTNLIKLVFLFLPFLGRNDTSQLGLVFGNFESRLMFSIFQAFKNSEITWKTIFKRKRSVFFWWTISKVYLHQIQSFRIYQFWVKLHFRWTRPNLPFTENKFLCCQEKYLLSDSNFQNLHFLNKFFFQRINISLIEISRNLHVLYWLKLFKRRNLFSILDFRNVTFWTKTFSKKKKGCCTSK